MMQKQNILHLLLGAALLTGCSADMEQGPNAGGIPIDLGYNVVTATDQTGSGTEQTRAATNLNDDKLTSVTVAVSVKKSSEAAYTTAYNYTAAATGVLSPATANQFCYEVDGSSSDIIAYYPATAAGSETPNLTSAVTFSVQTNQTTDANYQASDLMWAQQLYRLPAYGKVTLPFTHKLSKIIVNASAGSGVTSITSVTLNNVLPDVPFTASTGALGAATGTATSITMSNEGAAIIPPQTINGSFITIVTNAGTAIYAVENKEFESGHQYTLNITVNAAAIGTTNTITGWTSEGTVNVQPTVEAVLPDRTPPGVTKVDLGIYVGGAASGKKLLWADRNIGATSVTDYGLYFAWGDVIGRSGAVSSGSTAADGYSFSWTNTPYNYGSSSFAATKYTSSDGKTKLEKCDDAAYMNWGGGWRMPTKAEMNKLKALTNAWTDDYNGSGVAGCTFTGNGNTIFLPAAGFRSGTSVYGPGSDAYYWSSSSSSYEDEPWHLYFYPDYPSYYMSVSDNRLRYYGYPVRAVCEE